jgi:hypothetical protein
MIASAARYVGATPFPGYLSLDVYATGERPAGMPSAGHPASPEGRRPRRPAAA